MQIAIDIEILKSVRSMRRGKAQKIIEQTKRVRINWMDTLIERDTGKPKNNCGSADQPR